MAEVRGEEIAALLTEPLDRFVEVRTARVKALKAEGRKEEAAALSKVRKPAKLVWVLDEFARSHPDATAEAVEAADDVAAAQEGDGGDLRSLLGQFREALAKLAGIAGDADGSFGLALRAVLADPTARRAWSEGRLLELPHDEELGIPTAAAMAQPRPARARSPRPRIRDRHEREAARRTAEEAAGEEEARRRAQAAVTEAEEEVARASTERTAAAHAVTDLEEQRAAVEKELTGARRRLESADRAHEEVTSRVEQARTARTR